VSGSQVNADRAPAPACSNLALLCVKPTAVPASLAPPLADASAVAGELLRCLCNLFLLLQHLLRQV
jgi:hypothetical protein